MVRVTFGGADLEGLVVDQPAASVRLLLPTPGTDELVMPEWNGNEFLLPDGRRPTIRTFTPRRIDPDAPELDLDMVVHGEGAASTWAAGAAQGARAAVSGPGRGYRIDPDAAAFLLAGDETAIPAISQLLEVVPSAAAVDVHVEIAAPDARQPLPERAGPTTVSWHELPDGGRPGDGFVPAVEAADIISDTLVWVAGEAAAVQRVRRHLFEERGLGRSQATIRGYWKHGRAGDDG